MMLKPDHKDRTGNDKYEGYVVDLIQMISEEINITYEFKLRNDGNGKKDKKTGKWDGLIGEVQELVWGTHSAWMDRRCRYDVNLNCS
jgi:hypothetical protein